MSLPLGVFSVPLSAGLEGWGSVLEVGKEMTGSGILKVAGTCNTVLLHVLYY